MCLSNPIEIELPFPISSNTAYPTNNRGRRHLSKAARQWKDTALQLIGIALRGMSIAPPFGLVLFLYPSSRRRCDATNFLKLPQDAICEVLGVDDNWEIIPEVAVRVVAIDRNNPRCIVQVWK